MKAAYIERTGPPEVIQFGDMDVPVPGPTEVLIKVGAVGVNPIDTYIRSGTIAVPLKCPFIIGCDVAGTVERAGDQVTLFQAGDRVWGSNQGLMGRQGTFAEYIAVDQKWLYATPSTESDPQAVAGALVGITAHLGLFLHAGLKPGDVLFINGGTGGVGSSVVQLAKSIGAKVIATVGNAEKKKRCEELGADLAVDYHAPDLDDQIRAFTTPNGGINVWWETQREPTFDRTISMMAKRGRIVLMAGRDARPEFPVGPFYVNDLKLVGFAMFNATPEEQRTCGEAINALYDKGAWKPQIGETFPLARSADAHRLQEENTIGKKGTLSGKIVLVP